MAYTDKQPSRKCRQCGQPLKPRKGPEEDGLDVGEHCDNEDCPLNTGAYLTGAGDD